MTSGESLYLGIEGPNEISQDFENKEYNLVSLANVSDPEGEMVTRGCPYKFSMLNSPEISHHGKVCISPTW